MKNLTAHVWSDHSSGVNFSLGNFPRHIQTIKIDKFCCWTNAKKKNAANSTRNMIVSWRSYQSQGWNEPGASENLLLSVKKLQLRTGSFAVRNADIRLDS